MTAAFIVKYLYCMFESEVKYHTKRRQLNLSTRADSSTQPINPTATITDPSPFTSTAMHNRLVCQDGIYLGTSLQIYIWEPSYICEYTKMSK